MNFRNVLALLSKPKGGQFLDLVVGSEVVTHVTPLGNWLTPGVTKAGRISFSGVFRGRRVKVYSAYSAEQVKLRVFLDSLPFSGFSFPAVLAYDDRLIVEEWIEGREMKATAGFEGQASAIIDELHAATSLIYPGWLEDSPFCYFQDYLVPRLDRWLCVRPVADLLNDWKDASTRLGAAIEPRLCHPDLTFRNMIECPDTGRPVIVDNELLGVSRGWVLDWHNAGMPDAGLGRFSCKEELLSFAQLSWKLRRLGSLLDACDYRSVRTLLS